MNLAREDESRPPLKSTFTEDIHLGLAGPSLTRLPFPRLAFATDGKLRAPKPPTAREIELEAELEQMKVEHEQMMKELQEAEIAKKIQLMAEEKERSVLKAKREALRLVQVAEDAKKAAIMMMNDERDAAARAESQRLAELKLKGSDHVYKKALEANAGDTSRARYKISDLTEASSKNMVATHRLNIALRNSITKSLCYLAGMAINKLNKVTYSSAGNSTPPPGLTRCAATPVPTMRNSEVGGIKKTPSRQGSSTRYQDCHSTCLSTKRKDAKGKLSSDKLYKEYLKRHTEERKEAANKKENKTGATKDVPCRKSILETIPEMDLRQYC